MCEEGKAVGGRGEKEGGGQREGPKHIMCVSETVKGQKVLLVKILLQG